MIRCYTCYNEFNIPTLTLEVFYSNEDYPDFKIYARDFEKMLGVNIRNETQFKIFFNDWRAFCLEPKKYKNVIPIIKEWWKEVFVLD